MNVGIIGLGKMGSGVASRLLAGQHEVVVYNRTAGKAEELIRDGAQEVSSIKELVSSLTGPRIVWLYLPSGATTDEHIAEIVPLLSPGDIIIDGGNSNYKNTKSQAAFCAKHEVHLVDAGTSGGVAGKEKGYCIMIGGDSAIVEQLNPLWESVACKDGFAHVGPNGSGHYVKMVHNAIEYGMMQAYAEGCNILQIGEFGESVSLEKVANLWQHGSIIESYLGELLAESFKDYDDLSEIGERVNQNGEALWSIEEALQLGVPVPVITAALYARFNSQGNATFAHKVVAVLRYKFGGHAHK